MLRIFHTLFSQPSTVIENTMTSLTTRTHRLTIEGGTLHAQSWHPENTASTVPLVLFHDSLGCIQLWRGFPEQLAQHCQRPVIAYDRLGFGLSDTHPSRLTNDFIRDEADTAFSALQQYFGFNQCIVFGHSVGGAMAAECAAHYPEVCLALVTESSQAFVEPHTLQGIRQAQQNFAQPEQLERLARYHGDKAAWVLSAWIDTWLQESYQHWALDNTLRQIRCPVLVLHGEHDEFGSLAHPQRFASLPHGPTEFHLLDNCGHVPHREQPERVLSLLSDFIQQHQL